MTTGNCSVPLARAAVSAVLVVAFLGLGATPAQAQPIEDEYSDPGPWPSIVYDNGNTGPCSLNVAPSQDYTFVYSGAIGFAGAKHPIVVFGGGTNADNHPDHVCRYAEVLEHFASWGIVVVAPNEDELGEGIEMLEAVDLIIDLNDDPSSPFYDNLDTSNIAAVGHSQGAGGAVNAAIDSNGLITSVLPLGFPRESGWTTPFPELSDLTVPVFFVRGSNIVENLFSPESENQAAFNNVSGPAAKATVCGDSGPFCASGDGAGHFNTINAVGYMTAWLMYTLTGDATARAAFVGSPPEIATNGGATGWTNWQSKNLP